MIIREYHETFLSIRMVSNKFCVKKSTVIVFHKSVVCFPWNNCNL